MKKRALSMFLAVLTVLTLCAPALAADEPEVADVLIDSGECGLRGDNLTWELDYTGTLTISGQGQMKEYDIGGSPWYWSSNKSKIKHIDIRPGVTSIGSWVFMGCGDVTSISIPNSVTSIGEGAFSSCSNLYDISIPSTVTYIGRTAFSDCISLNDITIPGGLRTIESRLFDGCRGLINITIPNNVTSIGYSAFQDCVNLQTVDIPASVTEIGYSAFDGCSRLTTLKIRNPNCDFPWTSICPKSTIIYGYSGSTAEEYAKENGIQFKVLAAPKNGLKKENGKTYFYKDDVKQKGLWIIGGKKYYFSTQDCHMITNSWIKVNGANKYYAGADGVLYTGYKTIGTKNYYFSVKDCHLMKGGLVTGPGNKQYYVSAKDGHAMKGGWAQGPNHWWYYLDKTGVVIEKVRQNARPTYTPKG